MPVTWTDEDKAMLARIDERTKNMERRLASGDTKMGALEEKYQDLPCKTMQEKVKTHGKLILIILTGLIGLSIKTIWGII